MTSALTSWAQRLWERLSDLRDNAYETRVQAARDAVERARVQREYWSDIVRTVVGSAVACGASNVLITALSPSVFPQLLRASLFDRQEFVARVIALGHAVVAAALGAHMLSATMRGGRAQTAVVDTYGRAAAISIGYWLYDFINSVRLGNKHDVLLHHIISAGWVLVGLIKHRLHQYHALGYVCTVSDAIVHVVWMLKKLGYSSSFPAPLWNSLLFVEVAMFFVQRLVYAPGLFAHYIVHHVVKDLRSSPLGIVGIVRLGTVLTWFAQSAVWQKEIMVSARKMAM